MMKLIRISQTNNATFGVLLEGDTPFALTLEPPWLDNKPFISCIPAGTYTCQLTESPKFGLTYEVMDVEGRTHILFHKGNTQEDTSGCILVGEEFADTNAGNPWIKSSAKGFLEFISRIHGEITFELEIQDKVSHE